MKLWVGPLFAFCILAATEANAFNQNRWACVDIRIYQVGSREYYDVQPANQAFVVHDCDFIGMRCWMDRRKRYYFWGRQRKGWWFYKKSVGYDPRTRTRDEPCGARFSLRSRTPY